MRKKLKEALDYLGEEYSIKTIDMAECMYRDLRNGFDIEVSGICSRRKDAICVYVWNMGRGGIRIVDQVEDISNLIELKVILDALCEKWSKKLTVDISAK